MHISHALRRLAWPRSVGSVVGVWAMLEFVQGCLEIFCHGDFAGVCSIVPVNGEFAEEGTGPID